MDKKIALWLWARGWKNLARCIWPKIEDANAFLFPPGQPGLYISDQGRKFAHLEPKPGKWEERAIKIVQVIRTLAKRVLRG